MTNNNKGRRSTRRRVATTQTTNKGIKKVVKKEMPAKRPLRSSKKTVKVANVTTIASTANNRVASSPIVDSKPSKVEVRKTVKRRTYSLPTLKSITAKQASKESVKVNGKSSKVKKASPVARITAKVISKTNRKAQKTAKTRKPKPPTNAFIFYVLSMRTLAIRSKHPEGACLDDYCGHVANSWQRMTEADKKPFMEKAQADFYRYQKEQSDFLRSQQ